MKDLATFLIKNITGSDSFDITEQSDNERIDVNVKASDDIVGLIIGKEGKTIKNIRKILSIKATKQDKMVNINVNQG